MTAKAMAMLVVAVVYAAVALFVANLFRAEIFGQATWIRFLVLLMITVPFLVLLFGGYQRWMRGKASQ